MSVATSVLDATAGGKHLWHGKQKDADRVVFLDRRKLKLGEIDQQPSWEVMPNVQADFRRLPFADSAFDLVCFDPPHRVTDGGMEAISGIIETKYGVLRAESWQADILAGFEECWRVLAPGGTLTMKWSDATRSNANVLNQLPETPLYGTNTEKTDSATSWWVFHKPRE
jgi:ubiquinone/menaquinone biosynthesis C-methylase UbiE